MGHKFELDAEFSDADLETLLDALDGWESSQQELLYMIDKLQKMGDPPADMDSDYRNAFMQFRTHICSQEGKAKKDKKIRREKAILIKAKIILMQQRKGVDQFCDEASEPVKPNSGKKRPRHPEVPESDEEAGNPLGG